MSGEKLLKLQEIIYNIDKNTMFSRKLRKELVNKICAECSMWKESVNSFVEEMDGLNFHLDEDRKIFLEFAEHSL